MARAKKTAREPRPEMVISDVEQLRAISDPLRIRLIEAMAELPLRGWTAKELAEQLKTKQTKLYHHLNLLEERGFIEVAETRMVSGILEKRYRVTAVSFRVERSLLTGGGTDAIAEVLDAIFDKARSEIVAGQRAGLIDLAEKSKKTGHRTMALWASHARLSPASVRKVQRLVERLAAMDDLEEPDGIDYGLVVAFYPRATETED
jgi:DNA-binding transcriptional ArsR family regulator